MLLELVRVSVALASALGGEISDGEMMAEARTRNVTIFWTFSKRKYSTGTQEG